MKPSPIADPGTKPYWEGLKQERILLKRCLNCGNTHFYPRELCPHCYSDDLDWVEASGNGTVYSYTVVHRPAGPAYADDVPYTVAVVELAEGPRMMSWITGGKEVRIGAPVKATFVTVGDTVLPMFELLSD